MDTDIFIKTYHKDFKWLKYCLKSIEKYATGFRNIIIVADDDGHVIPSEYLIKNCKVFYVGLPDNRPSYVEHGIGYLWQQCIKLSWYNYSDANAVLIMDSDEMFTESISPISFQKEGKFTWNYRPWSEAGSGICWKKSTDFLLNTDTTYDAMAITGFVLQRETTIALKNCLCSTHGTKDIWDIFVKHNMSTASEFNIFGSFIHHFDRREYTQVHNFNRENCVNFSIRKSWSWGGISEEEDKLRNALLQ
jgi:hypothetical protein